MRKAGHLKDSPPLKIRVLSSSLCQAGNTELVREFFNCTLAVVHGSRKSTVVSRVMKRHLRKVDPDNLVVK